MVKHLRIFLPERHTETHRGELEYGLGIPVNGYQKKELRKMPYKLNLLTKVAFFCSTLFLGACGGGGSSNSGMVIEGTLTEAGGAADLGALNFKHSERERIEEVEVCALGKCSITDGAGQWGFQVGEDFTGGEAEFSFKGHGIDTTSVVAIEPGANDIFLDFQHLPGGHVEAVHITNDGETSHHENEEHSHAE